VSERVLCVRREELFRDGAWDGLTSDRLDDVRRLIRERSCFMPRRDVEEDPGYQQVIPYVVFRHGDRYLLTRRLKASSEKRLRHLYSLGVGGHINPEDVANGDPVLDGMRREWEEEVAYAGRITARLLGLIHEESAPVGRVHLGVVFLVEGDLPEIAIRETEKLSGELLTLDEMRIHYLEMESWSQIVYDTLARGGGPPLPEPPLFSGTFGAPSVRPSGAAGGV
jgi:predicted NUDIX family phosphoesterase